MYCTRMEHRYAVRFPSSSCLCGFPFALFSSRFVSLNEPLDNFWLSHIVSCRKELQQTEMSRSSSDWSGSETTLNYRIEFFAQEKLNIVCSSNKQIEVKWKQIEVKWKPSPSTKLHDDHCKSVTAFRHSMYELRHSICESRVSVIVKFCFCLNALSIARCFWSNKKRLDWKETRPLL